jgi:hypothetical protein
MVADRATGGGADKTMMTGKMPRGASHQRALDASFGVGWCGYGKNRNRNRGAPKNPIHLLAPGKRIEDTDRPEQLPAAAKVPNECRAT